jgi:hypothetical protein
MATQLLRPREEQEREDEREHDELHARGDGDAGECDGHEPDAP